MILKTYLPILIVHEQYQPIHMFNLHMLNSLIKAHCTYHVAIYKVYIEKKNIPMIALQI